jgi:hypothetical protein
LRRTERIARRASRGRLRRPRILFLMSTARRHVRGGFPFRGVEAGTGTVGATIQPSRPTRRRTPSSVSRCRRTRSVGHGPVKVGPCTHVESRAFRRVHPDKWLSATARSSLRLMRSPLPSRARGRVGPPRPAPPRSLPSRDRTSPRPSRAAARDAALRVFRGRSRRQRLTRQPIERGEVSHQVRRTRLAITRLPPCDRGASHTHFARDSVLTDACALAEMPPRGRANIVPPHAPHVRAPASRCAEAEGLTERRYPAPVASIAARVAAIRPRDAVQSSGDTIASAGDSTVTHSLSGRCSRACCPPPLQPRTGPGVPCRFRASGGMGGHFGAPHPNGRGHLGAPIPINSRRSPGGGALRAALSPRPRGSHRGRR